jgi:hypothetical protein
VNAFGKGGSGVLVSKFPFQMYHSGSIFLGNGPHTLPLSDRLAHAPHIHFIVSVVWNQAKYYYGPIEITRDSAAAQPLGRVRVLVIDLGCSSTAERCRCFPFLSPQGTFPTRPARGILQRTFPPAAAE